MGIVRLPYESLTDLLAHEPVAEEDPQTIRIIKRLRHVKSDRELSRGEFLDICYWKSARSIRRCERNSAAAVEKTSKKVMRTRSEKRRLELLTSLQGVSVPTASAILTLTNPERYGVIDIRVWELLYALESVKSNPRGQGFTFRHWHQYLQILRHHAKRLRVPVRLIELTLFKFHQKHQTGTLYRRR
jgi:thermostable 8-oxoguanine DNA glycosylase